MRLASVASAALLLGAVALSVAVPADSAEAFAVVCPGSSLCSPELPAIMTALGSMSSGAGASTVAVATAGVAGLGAFNTSIGVTAAFTAVGVGATIANGLLVTRGVPGGVSLKTSAGSGESSSTGGTTPMMYGATNQLQLTGGPNPYSMSHDGYTVYCYVADNFDSTDAANDFTPHWVNTSGASMPMFFTGGGSRYNNIGGGWFPAPNYCPSNYGFYYQGGVGQRDGTMQSITVNTGADAGKTFVLSGPTAGGWYGTIRTTVHCAGAVAADTPVIATAAVALPGGATLPVPAASCAPGLLATGTTIEFAPTTTGTWIPLANGTVPGVVSGMVTNYPDCFGPGVSPCSLLLERVSGPGFVSCGPLAVLCPNWVAESVADPTSFRCVYGSYTLTLDLCSSFRVPGQVLPNTDSSGATVSRSAARNAVPPQVAVDSGSGTPLTTPPVYTGVDPPIVCPLGGGDNFFTSIVPFFQSLPGWVGCMVIPQGFDRGGKIPLAAAPLLGAQTTLVSSLPTSIVCGPVGNMPLMNGGSIALNTCPMDVLPEPAKTVIGYAMVFGIAWYGVKRILWALGGDAAPRVEVKS